MIEFFYHDGIQKEIVALERRFRTIRDEEMNKIAISRVSDFF